MRLSKFESLPKSRWLVPPAGQRNVDSREGVRQWLILQLEASYHFPRTWIRDRVKLVDDKLSQLNVTATFFGFYLATAQDDPFLLVSVDPDKDKAEYRLRECLRHSHFARLGVSSDGSLEGTRFVRQRSNSEDADIVLDIEPYTSPDRLKFAEPCRAPLNGETAFRTLEPISSALEDLFFQAHSHIRDIDGLHADESLDELCKVIYAKLFDEEMTSPGKPYQLQRGLTATTEEFAAVVRRVYIDANDYDVRVFSLKVPGYDRSRGVFNNPLRLSSAALAKVVETFETCWLSRSSIDVKGRAFQRVLGPALRAGMGQYFTPQEVIRFMVAVINPKVTDLILDPFSGSGHFLTNSLDLVRRSEAGRDDKALNEFAFNKLHGIEKSDRMVRVAMTDMRLHGDGHSNIRCTDALLDFQNYPDIRPESFDVILTNPPFGSLLGAEAVSKLGRFALARRKGAVPLEILGLERCIQFLRPGGRLGIVLPDGILANRSTAYVRDWLAEQAKIRAVVSLPIETFSPFGANIKTSILFARKWKNGERRTKDHKVHLVKIDNIGYDASGRMQQGSELIRATESISEYFSSEEW